MKHALGQITINISLVLFSANLYGQNGKMKLVTSSWEDTTFISIVLDDTIKDSKTVAVDIGQKAIIYVKLKLMMLEAKTKLSNDFIRENYKKIIQFFDSASRNSDTIFIDKYYQLPDFKYLVSQQLIDGNARVYYKKEKSFVGTISYRIERYRGDADRFLYLPNKRAFFAVQEFSGILDNDEDLGQGHFGAYVKEGEKLQSIRKE